MIVSTGPSWRIDGLVDAAQFTGLEVEIAQQPNWSSAVVDQFRGYVDAQSPPSIGPGQARCWLGHLNALEYVVQNDWASALILEDDVDWDVAIKRQTALVSPHIHRVTNSTSRGTLLPYGNNWDLLWLGHCGDTIPRVGVVKLFDETLPDTSTYRENNGRLTRLTAQPKTRMVHLSHGPACTYAYAVTKSAARKIVHYAKDGMKNIITVDLRKWCQAGFLTCVTVNPELFHHHKKSGMMTSEVAAAEGWQELTQPPMLDYTANIRYSARCNSHSEVVVSCQDEFKGPIVAATRHPSTEIK